MKRKILLILVSIIGIAELSVAQEKQLGPADSAKKQERVDRLTSRIDHNKQKLAQLEKELSEKEDFSEKARAQAEESADKNRKAAVRLSNDAQDRKKAKRAENFSDQAKRDAKRARKAFNSVKEIESDIKLLKKKISRDEKTLSELHFR